VSLVSGSSVVTGTNTAFKLCGPLRGAIRWIARMVLDGTPAAFPANNAAGDPVSYTIASCTDATHLNVDSQLRRSDLCGLRIPDRSRGGGQYLAGAASAI